MGEIYLAEDLRLGRSVAIKLLSPHLRADAEANARFQHEARAASALDHPNICAVHDINETPDGRTYMVMAYYDGETLERRLERGPLEVGEAVATIAQVAQGLAIAHAAGIVHRDIKPSNVMATREGVMKILDFGLAKIIDASTLTRSGASLGTPAYMSPEQVNGAVSDHRADLWALGVMLHHCVTGRLPFPGDNIPAMMYSILNRVAEPLDSGDPVLGEIESLRDRCLVKDPEQRLSDAAALAANLRVILRSLHQEDDGDGYSTSTPAAVHPALAIARRDARHARRSKALGWMLAATAAMVVVALAWTLVRWVIHRAEPIRVAVLPVEVDAPEDSTELALVTSGAHIAAVRSLSNLLRVATVDPAELKGVSGSPVQIARTIDADEVIGMNLEVVRDEWKVTLRRLSGRDGMVRWTDEFMVPREPGILVANAIEVHLRRGYPGHGPRNAPRGEARRPADYDEFLRLQRAYDARGTGSTIPIDEVTRRLDLLIRQAPEFLEAHLLDAEVATYRFDVGREPAFLDRAETAALRGAALAPDRPYPINQLFGIAMRRSQFRRADSLLAELRRVDPASTAVVTAEAEIALRLGNAGHALKLLRQLAGSRPSRANVWRLADLEYRQGRVAEARAHLQVLMERYPDYLLPRARLGQLELIYGSPERAQSIYRDLVERAPATISYHTNLGLARMLLGDYTGALTELERAREMSPSSMAVLLNLADVELLRGDSTAAMSLYRRTLELVRANPASETIDYLISAAQCLAHLGRDAEAVETAERALAKAPDNAQAQYMGSLVYALAGENSKALVCVNRATSLHFSRHWFRFPWFEPLRDDARFRQMIAGK